MNKKFVKRAVAMVLCVVMLIGAINIYSAASITFTDVTRDTVYTEAYESILKCANAGIVSGVGDNKFSPFTDVANPEMVKMIVNAYFRANYNAYEAEHITELTNYFGNRYYWFSYMSYYAKQVGLLDGINVDIRTYNAYYKPMTRYDMAQLLANTAKVKGITASESDKAIAKTTLVGTGDYFDIPANYLDAVVTCYALGLLNGKGSDGFCGTDNMNRAEACIVLLRIEKLLLNGGGTTTDPKPDPTPSVPTVKDIVVTSVSGTDRKGGTGTIWTVTDNSFNDGYLNNGKEVNENNIKELLAKAKTIWPTDMAWTSPGTANNNWYNNGYSVASSIPNLSGTNSSGNTGGHECTGFAVMLSDYLFGKNSNPWREISLSEVRPGDILIEYYANGSPKHVTTAIDTIKDGNATTHIYEAQGNHGNKVYWANITGNSWDIWEALPVEGSTNFRVYTRYPA